MYMFSSHGGLTGQRSVQLALALYAIHGCARAAEAVAAAAAAHQLVTRVFHRAHNSKSRGHLVFFAHQIDVNHIAFHPSYVRRLYAINTRPAARPARQSGTPGRPCIRTCCPTLQRPHLPMPHFMRISSVVNTCVRVEAQLCPGPAART